LLEETIIKPRLIACMRVLEIAFRCSSALVLAENQVDLRYFFQHEVRQCRRMRVIRSTHLNAQAYTLPCLLRQVKHLFYVIGKFEASGPRLHFAPRWTYVEL